MGRGGGVGWGARYQRGVERKAVAEDGEVLAHALPPARAHPEPLLERRLRRVQHPACWRARPNLFLVALGCLLRSGELLRAQHSWEVEVPARPQRGPS